MERITYRITLDAHKNGIQRTLQGFETADNMARRIAVNLMANGDTYEIPSNNVVALMYVTMPGTTEPSINECTIEGNTIVYDVLPITKEGIVDMQLKLIKTSVSGAKSVLISPRFSVEVIESGVNDDNAEQTTTFTALENAVAMANSVYEGRLIRIAVDDDCTFRALYADGTVYENDSLKKALHDGNALLSESWAVGGTGTREGENTNNSKYYSDVSKSAASEANKAEDDIRELVDEAQMYSAFTTFDVDFETGELKFLSRNYGFDIDEETGELMVDGGDDYSPEDLIGSEVDKYAADFDRKIAVERARIDSFISLDEGSTTGDAELIDGRIDKEGKTHTNIGEHIREITSKISSEKVNKDGEKEVTIKNLDFSVVNIGINKLNLNDPHCVLGKAFNVNGEIVDSGCGLISNFIKYEYGKNLVFSRRNPENDTQALIDFNSFVVYDKNKKAIANEYSESGIDSPYAMNNENAKYIRISYHSYSADRQFQIEVTDNTTYSNYMPYSEEAYIPKEYLENDRYKGKKISVIGDSITDMDNGYVTKNWLGLLEENEGFVTVNLAKSGTGYINGVTENKSFWSRTKQKDYIPTDSDIVVIFGSLNDASAISSMSLPYGDVTDGIFDRANSTSENEDKDNMQNNYNYKPSTVYGYINATINNIYAQLPNAVLGIISPNPWAAINPMSKSTQNNIGRDYVDILKKVCEYRGIPFLDLFRTSGLRPWTYATKQSLYYNSDGVHPNELGHELFLYPRIRGFINTLI